jgi:Cys-rich repeat protein
VAYPLQLPASIATIREYLEGAMRISGVACNWAALAMALAGLNLSTGCSSDDPKTTITSRLRVLDDADRDRLLEERTGENGNNDDERGPIILPEPGDCPVMQWRETHTVLTDSNGEVISESWQVCTQCFEEDGTTPIGEETCFDEPPVPPDVICEEYKTEDPTVICYRCTTPDGEIVEDECYAVDLPVECSSDADCGEGEICEIYIDVPIETEPGESCGDDDPPPPPIGYCVPQIDPIPDPCQPVESLPDDPTGIDCYVCVDPVTGEDWGGFCTTHPCSVDADCDAARSGDVCVEGLCTWSEGDGGKTPYPPKP